MKRRTSRRMLVMVLLLLAGGAIVNVAVAWACVLFFVEDVDGHQIGFPSSADQWLASNGWDPSSFSTETPAIIANTSAPKHWDNDPNSVKLDGAVRPNGWLDQWRVEFHGHEFLRFDWTPRTLQYPYPPIAGQIRAGWPLYSLYGEASAAAHGPAALVSVLNTRTLSYNFRYAWLPANQAKYPPAIHRAFPLLPLWPGFAINTVTYAAVVWTLFTGPGFVRRRIRAKRGLCPACAYDLRGRDGHSTACPECGMNT